MRTFCMCSSVAALLLVTAILTVPAKAILTVPAKNLRVVFRGPMNIEAFWGGDRPRYDWFWWENWRPNGAPLPNDELLVDGRFVQPVWQSDLTTPQNWRIWTYEEVITDGGSITLYGPEVEVGFAGGVCVGLEKSATMEIASGAYLAASAYDTYVGLEATAEGHVVVSGAGSTWDICDRGLYLGYRGSGSLTVSDGGVVSNIDAYGSDPGSYLGYHAGSSGEVTVSGAGSTWAKPAKPLYVAYDGSGSLTIADGGVVSKR